MFTLPTILLLVCLGVLIICVVVLFMTVSKLKKRISKLEVSLLETQSSQSSYSSQPSQSGYISQSYARTTSQAPARKTQGRGKPVIPFGEDRSARERAYNKYANEAVEQDIAPDSIDFSKVAPKLNINRGQGNLGVYDASNARRIKGNVNRRR